MAPHPQSRPGRITTVLVGLAAAVAVLALAGWLTGTDVLTRLHPGLPQMTPLTAVAVLALVGACLTPTRPRVTQAAALLAAAIGVWAVAAHVLAVPVAGPWRPSVPTGVAVVGLAATFSSRIGAAGRVWAVVVAAAPGYVALLGYLFHVSVLYQPLDASIGMSLPTVVAATALVLFRVRQLDDAGQVPDLSPAARTLLLTTLPLVVFVPPLLLAAVQLVATPGIGTSMVLFAAAELAVLLATLAHASRTLTREQAHRTDTERFAELLLDHAPDAMLVVDADGTIRQCNQAAYRLFGHPRGSLVGDSIATLVPVDVRGRHRELMDGYLADPVARPLDSRHLRAARADGTEVPVQISLAPASTAEGLVVIVAVRDVTAEQQRLQAEQEHAHRLEAAVRHEQDLVRQLRELNTTRSLLVSSISHEVRTPLAVIVGAVELLSSRRPDPDQAAELAAGLHRHALRLETLLANLLALGQADASPDVQVRRDPVQLDQVVRRQVDRLGIGATHPLQLELDPVEVLGDRGLLHQVAVSLLTNAMQYTPAGAPVHVRLTCGDGTAHLVVADGGPGIPPALRARVFEPFQRGEQVDPAQPGVGVGLTMAREFVRTHDGRIWIDDSDLGGAAVHVQLPHARVHQHPGGARDDEQPAPVAL